MIRPLSIVIIITIIIITCLPSTRLSTWYPYKLKCLEERDEGILWTLEPHFQREHGLLGRFP